MTGKPGGVKILGSSKKADMYSFAITCSFILTGMAPFSGYENRESLKQAVKDGARPHLPDYCPVALATLLRRCWNSDPTKRPESFCEILTELREPKANLLTSAIDGVESPEAEPPKEPVVTFNLGDRRLNIVIVGDPESVEAVVSHICGRRQTLFEDHVNLRECRTSSPPMCLYSHTKGITRNYLTDIRTFVKVRNKKWRPIEVVPLWVKEVHDPGPRNRPALLPDSTSRLHMVWFACRKESDLPNLLKWPEITEKLCDLPVQILVIEKQNVQQEFNEIFKSGRDYFPNAQSFMEKFIVKVDLEDDDLKEKLWRACWALRKRVEIGNAAKINREVQKCLESGRISEQKGVGGARLRKDVSLSRSGEFVFNFFDGYSKDPAMDSSVKEILESMKLAA